MTAMAGAVYAVACACAVSVLLIALRHRQSTVALGLVCVMSGLSVWTAADLLKTLESSVLRHLGTSLVFSAMPLTATGYLLVSQLIVNDNWRPSRTLQRLLVAGVVVPQVAWLTNAWHRLAVTRYDQHQDWFLWAPGPVFWLVVGYVFALCTWALAVIVRALPSVSPLHRPQIRSILIGAVAPLVASWFTLKAILDKGGHDSRDLDWTALAFMFTALIDYWAFRRQGLMRVVPVARALVMEQLPDAIFVLDVEDRVIDVNPQAGGLVEAVAPRQLPFLDPPRPGDYRLSLADLDLELEVRLAELRSHQGREIGRAVVVRDVTAANRNRRKLAETNSRLKEQIQANERLRRELVEQTLRDALTGLHNRRHLERTFARHVERAAEQGEPFAVVIVDVDHFKSVNDLHGHAIGDELLVAISQFLAQRVRHEDTLARFGGEEFVAILSGCDALDAYTRIQAWIDEAILVRVRAGNVRVSRTLSAGIAVYPGSGTTRDEMIAAADMALYEAKGEGRNRVKLAPTCPDVSLSRRRAPRHRAQ